MDVTPVHSSTIFKAYLYKIISYDFRKFNFLHSLQVKLFFFFVEKGNLKFLDLKM